MTWTGVLPALWYFIGDIFDSRHEQSTPIRALLVWRDPVAREQARSVRNVCIQTNYGPKSQGLNTPKPYARVGTTIMRGQYERLIGSELFLELDREYPQLTADVLVICHIR